MVSKYHSLLNSSYILPRLVRFAQRYSTAYLWQLAQRYLPIITNINYYYFQINIKVFAEIVHANQAS